MAKIIKLYEQMTAKETVAIIHSNPKPFKDMVAIWMRSEEGKRVMDAAWAAYWGRLSWIGKLSYVWDSIAWRLWRKRANAQWEARRLGR